MAAEDNPVTGVDTSVELLIDGAPVGLIDCVTNFTFNAEFDDIVVRPIGTTGAKRDRTPTGWRGEIEIATQGPQLDDFIDAYNAALAERQPIEITITSNTNYRDRSQRRHLYLNCTIDFGRRVQRGSPQTTNLGWQSGEDRKTFTVN